MFFGVWFLLHNHPEYSTVTVGCKCYFTLYIDLFDDPFRDIAKPKILITLTFKFIPAGIFPFCFFELSAPGFDSGTRVQYHHLLSYLAFKKVLTLLIIDVEAVTIGM